MAEKKDYGVPIAARIDADLAFEFSKRAERAGMTMSAYVNMFLTKMARQSDKVEAADEDLRREKEMMREVIGKFITAIGETAEKRQKLVAQFNQIKAEVYATRDISRT